MRNSGVEVSSLKDEYSSEVQYTALSIFWSRNLKCLQLSWSEQSTHNRQVVGSSPTRHTINLKGVNDETRHQQNGR